jgi:myosin protein heavy chain
LLEKSRVVTRGQNERNFHIFYQMLSGMDVQKKATFGLTSATDYDYLNKTKLTAKMIDDVKEYGDTLKAMEVLGFTNDEQELVFSLVAAILHLGNVQFSGDDVSSKIDNGEIITDRVSLLLGVEGRALIDALLHPHIVAGAAKAGQKAERIKRDLSKPKAESSRDALVKALYGRAFLWIVDKINQSLRVKPTHKFIGILDIAGFEIFKHNSFEQLCINFTNERLQQFFNMHMFELEQAEYQREGIVWKVENFGMDGRATIDLIGTRPKGILVILDEDNARGSLDDVAFTRKLSEMHKNHPKYVHNQLGGNLEFALKHYAGDVTYDTTDWLTKNMDPLENDLEDVIRGSKNKVLANLFADFALGGRNKGAAFITIANQYRTQLDDLLKTLQRTHPHFIRCVYASFWVFKT